MEASVTIMISVFMVMMRKGEGLSQMGEKKKMAYRVGFGGSVWKRVLGLLAFKARPS